jgi:photosystem II stability/assembly factor-like uncharacterized protein
LLLLLVCLGACGPSAASPSPSPSGLTSPTPAVTSTPTATVSAAPTSTGVPSATPIPLPTTAQVAAAGNGVVWMDVNGDHLFLSLDRGTTWTARTLPNARPSGGMAFVNDRDGWFLETLPPSGQCSSQDTILWRTRDGAQSWQKLSASGLASAQCKSSVAFVDADRGYIPTYDENGAPRIYSTADGGQTWTASAPLADPPGFVSGPGGKTLRPDTIADFGSVLYVDALAFNDASRFNVYRSTDRGATWAFASAAPIQAAPVIFITPSRWLQIDPGSARETSDSGASWHVYATDYGQAAPIPAQFVFGDANTGYATVRGGLTRTTDGGAHWVALRTPGT